MGYPTYGKTLAKMTEEVTANNYEKGWLPTANTFGDDIALLHTEVSEAMEAFRRWGVADAGEAQCLDAAMSGEMNGHDELGHLCKPQGVGSEFADVLIRLLDNCYRHDIDLEAEYERKMAYNRTRPYRHGEKKL